MKRKAARDAFQGDGEKGRDKVITGKRGRIPKKKEYNLQTQGSMATKESTGSNS